MYILYVCVCECVVVCMCVYVCMCMCANRVYYCFRFDDLSVRALRALYSSADEWETLFPDRSGRLSGSGNFNFNLDFLGQPLSPSTEKRVATAMKKLIAAELSSKPTSVEADIALLQNTVRDAQSSSSSSSSSLSSSGMYDFATISAIAFRIEKKRLLD